MTHHRFFIENIKKEERPRIEDTSLAHQLKKVLRVTPGSTVIFFDASGNEYVAAIKEIHGDVVEYEITGTGRNEKERARIHLFASIVKRENFEWIAQKATECGVASITPIRSGRTVKMDLKTERLKKIMKEAAEQSGRGYVPELFPVRTFAEARSDSFSGMSIMCDGSGKKIPPIVGDGKDIRVYVGPEGGWTEEERVLAEKHGLFVMSLGAFTLRAETAAVVATYVIVNAAKNRNK